MVSADISGCFKWLNETAVQGLLLILGLLVTKPTVYFITGAQKRGGGDWKGVGLEKRGRKMKEK